MSNNIIIKHCCCGSDYKKHEDTRWGNITGRIKDQGDLIDYINDFLVGGEVDLSDYSKKDWVLEQIANIHIPEAGITVAEVNVLIGNALNTYDPSSVVDAKIAQASAQTMQEVEGKGYLTEHQSLEGYATEEYVNQEISKIPTVDLSGYYTSAQTDAKIAQASAQTMQEVEGKGYLTEHQSLSGYATEEYVNQEVSKIPTVDLSGYYTSAQTDEAIAQASAATMQEVEAKGYLTEHQSLEGYATESWVEDKGYLTEHQSLEGYATTEHVNTLIGDIESALTRISETI